MAPLIYHRREQLAVAFPDYIRIKNLPHCKLRIINCQNQTDTALISCEILNKNDKDNTRETISLFHRQPQTEATVDIGWEGDIELASYQDLRVHFEDSKDVACTPNDILTVTIGYELL